MMQLVSQLDPSNSAHLLGYGRFSCHTVDEILRMGSRHFRLIQQYQMLHPVAFISMAVRWDKRHCAAMWPGRNTC